MKFLLVLLSACSLLLFSFRPVRNHSGSTERVLPASSGIKFSKMPLEKAIKQARSSGKLIFIDVQTTWCGPCKEMAQTTFVDSEVGEVFNKRFINLKVDAENDKDGPMISKAYTVTAYPTLLFINGEGKLVKKLVGKQSKEKLLAAVSSIK